MDKKLGFSTDKGYVEGVYDNYAKTSNAVVGASVDSLSPPRYITEVGVYAIDIVAPEEKDGYIPYGTTVILLIPNLNDRKQVNFSFNVSNGDITYEGTLFFVGGGVTEDGEKFGTLQINSNYSDDSERWIVNAICIAKFGG